MESLGARAAGVTGTTSTATSVTATCWEINAPRGGASAEGRARVAGARSQAPRRKRGRVGSEASSLGVCRERRCGCLSLPLLFLARFPTYP